MTYVLLIYRSARAAVPDERAALQAHRKLQKDVAARGDLQAVALLDDTRGARTVKYTANSSSEAGSKSKPGAHEIVDGPYAETKEWLVGFYLFDCASEEEALARAKVICIDDAHVVEVRPVGWQWKP